MQRTRVQSLVWEDPTCSRVTKPVRHNYWACALEPVSHNYWAYVPQLLSVCAATTEARLQQWRPNAAKKKKEDHRFELQTSVLLAGYKANWTASSFCLHFLIWKMGFLGDEMLHVQHLAQCLAQDKGSINVKFNDRNTFHLWGPPQFPHSLHKYYSAPTICQAPCQALEIQWWLKLRPFNLRSIKSSGQTERWTRATTDRNV